MTTRLDQIDGLVSLPPPTPTTSSSNNNNNNKRKIDDVNNHGLRRTPVQTTPFVSTVSTRPPRWNDLEVSVTLFIIVALCLLVD